jgi:hypothetical protein
MSAATAASEKEAKKLALKKEKEAKKAEKADKEGHRENKIKNLFRKKHKVVVAAPVVSQSATQSTKGIWGLAFLDAQSFPMVERFVNKCLMWLQSHQGALLIPPRRPCRNLPSTCASRIREPQTLFPTLTPPLKYNNFHFFMSIKLYYFMF